MMSKITQAHKRTEEKQQRPKKPAFLTLPSRTRTLLPPAARVESRGHLLSFSLLRSMASSVVDTTTTNILGVHARSRTVLVNRWSPPARPRPLDNPSTVAAAGPRQQRGKQRKQQLSLRRAAAPPLMRSSSSSASSSSSSSNFARGTSRAGRGVRRSIALLTTVGTTVMAAVHGGGHAGTQPVRTFINPPEPGERKTHLPYVTGIEYEKPPEAGLGVHLSLFGFIFLFSFFPLRAFVFAQNTFFASSVFGVTLCSHTTTSPINKCPLIVSSIDDERRYIKNATHLPPPDIHGHHHPALEQVISNRRSCRDFAPPPTGMAGMYYYHSPVSHPKPTYTQWLP